MTENLPRVLQNIFGENAMQGNKIAQFGSVIAGKPLYTGDIEEIQALQYWQNGWVGATFSDKRYPTSEETTGINKVVTQQLKYLFQKGIPEWHIDEVYYKNSYCQVDGAVFLSLTDDNIGHNPVGDSVNWIEALKAKEQDLSISNALSTGEVKNESKLYEQILRRAHSTFDKSKFEFVGSPNITDDGIASGFSSSNFIRAKYIPLGQNFKIYLPKFNSSDVAVTQNILRYSDGNVRAQIFNGKIRLFRYTSTSTYDLPIGSTSLKNNQDYYYYIEHYTDGEKYYLNGFISTDGINWSTDVSASSTQPMFDKQNSAPIQISGVDATFPFIGTIDLKQFSNIVAGIPAFNGNKTGLYIAKPDNYEVIGSPTITEDGRLSVSESGQISYANSIRSSNSIDISNLKDFSIFVKLPKKNANAYYRVFRNQVINNADGTANWNLESRSDIGSSGTGFRFIYYVTTDSGRGLKFLDFQLPEILQQDVEIGILYEKNSRMLKIIKYIDGIPQEVTSRVVTEDMSYVENCYFYFGMLNNYFLDLNSFRYYMNGNLVYQPCLKIPYTLSKTGSKIVDVAYRNRVQDLYEQTGEALFYTLDEENQDFTLPASDIYGMIENRANVNLDNLSEAGNTKFNNKLNKDHSNDTKPYITETYKNGQSGYRIWSDGYCEQWGYTTFNANGTTVTFPKEFIDTNYTLLCQINPGPGVHYGQTICVTAYNSSSFTANGGNTSSLQNKNGWWKACGYITV